MTEIIEIETERLRLRQWKKQDWPVFAELNSDPVVMEFFPDVLSEAESNAMAQKIASLISSNGWGFWALEELATSKFIGFVGLNEPDYIKL